MTKFKLTLPIVIIFGILCLLAVLGVAINQFGGNIKASLLPPREEQDPLPSQIPPDLPNKPEEYDCEPCEDEEDCQKCEQKKIHSTSMSAEHDFWFSNPIEPCDPFSSDPCPSPPIHSIDMSCYLYDCESHDVYESQAEDPVDHDPGISAIPYWQRYEQL